MELKEALTKLAALQAKMSAYYHAMSLIHYDGATTAPKGTAQNRAQTLGVLSEETYKLSTGDETIALLEYLDAHKDELDEKNARIVFLMLKDIREMKLPCSPLSPPSGNRIFCISTKLFHYFRANTH